MIGTLKGIVDELCGNHIILNVNNVGYVVHVTTRILNRLTLGESHKFYIETYVNRDSITQLYGFSDKIEQSCFRLLLKVNGISYKIAMSMLSKLTPDQIFSAILQDNKMILKVGGVGIKLISRIITELKQEVEKLNINFNLLESNINDDAILALINLGYDKSKVYSVINNLKLNISKLETQDIIRLALRELVL